MEMRLTGVTHDHRHNQVCDIRANDDIIGCALLKFDLRVLPKSAGQWRCASHVLHTITTTSEHDRCVKRIIGIVGR